MSSLYALSLSWRRIDEEKDLSSQNFINQWLAETFEVNEDAEIDLEAEARTLAAVITDELPRGTVPNWAEFVIQTVDRQPSPLRSGSHDYWPIGS